MSEDPSPLVSLGTTDEITTLRPDQCVIKMVNDRVVCLRGISPEHPAHDPKAPIGVTRKMVEKAIENSTGRPII